MAIQSHFLFHCCGFVEVLKLNTAAGDARLSMAQGELFELCRLLLADDLRSDALHSGLSLIEWQVIRVTINHKLQLSGDDERLSSLILLDLEGALGMLPARAIAFDRSLDFDVQVLNLLSKLYRYSLLHSLDVALSDRRWLGDE